MEYWTAFTLGVLGSLHCIGMCGPIALSLPYQSNHKTTTLINILTYNLGRTFSYSIIGIIPGVLGLGVFISGYQTGLSILLGTLMILLAVFSINPEKYLLQFPPFRKFNTWLQKQFSSLFNDKNKFTFLKIGILNGFLPCGMVYLAVAGAITQKGIIGAMTYMMLFGLGTIPMMILVAFSGTWLSLRFKKHLLKAMPIVLFFFGLMLIWRGLQIELPSDVNFWFLKSLQPMCH